MEPNFTEAEAKEVAEEDFKSDTQGKGFMRKSQLKHSLYELAMVWAQSQHDAASGTPEQIVFFLAELFGNIGEVLIVEGKRLVELKHLTEVKEVKAEMATNFRKKFRPRDEAKLKLLAAEEAAEAQRQRRLAAQARRRERTLSLAERLAAEALGAAHQASLTRLRCVRLLILLVPSAAEWRQQMTFFHEDLNGWELELRDLRQAVEFAKEARRKSGRTSRTGW